MHGDARRASTNVDELENMLTCVDSKPYSYFESYVVGGDAAAFAAYVAAKRVDGAWGDDLEIFAMCEVYGRPAQIWAFDAARGARRLRTFCEPRGELRSVAGVTPRVAASRPAGP